MVQFVILLTFQLEVDIVFSLFFFLWYAFSNLCVSGHIACIYVFSAISEMHVFPQYHIIFSEHEHLAWYAKVFMFSTLCGSSGYVRFCRLILCQVVSDACACQILFDVYHLMVNSSYRFAVLQNDHESNFEEAQS